MVPFPKVLTIQDIQSTLYTGCGIYRGLETNPAHSHFSFLYTKSHISQFTPTHSILEHNILPIQTAASCIPSNTDHQGVCIIPMTQSLHHFSAQYKALKTVQWVWVLCAFWDATINFYSAQKDVLMVLSLEETLCQVWVAKVRLEASQAVGSSMLLPSSRGLKRSAMSLSEKWCKTFFFLIWTGVLARTKCNGQRSYTYTQDHLKKDKSARGMDHRSGQGRTIGGALWGTHHWKEPYLCLANFGSGKLLPLSSLLQSYQGPWGCLPSDCRKLVAIFFPPVPLHSSQMSCLLLNWRPDRRQVWNKELLPHSPRSKTLEIKK